MSDTKELIERLRTHTLHYSEQEAAADTIALLESERDAARETARRLMEAERGVRREAMEECAQICDAEATVEGIAQRCAAAIRAAMKGEQ